MTRFLSGVQPSGRPHLGNYLGAIQQHVALQKDGTAYYFIADYHALTTVQNAETLREHVRDLACTYLALGLDPKRSVFWRQSDVPEVTELTWLLSTVIGMGLLERGHSYKDKVAKGLTPNAGLFLYPVLMAADILAYDADYVPVGKDQVQHVEFAQDMAGAFNALYGDVFKRPEWKLSESPRVVGLDGEKMSKSYGNDLWVFEEGKALKKRVGKIPTDSRAPEDPKDPDGMLIFDWLEMLCPKDEYEDLCRRARAGGEGGPGYGELKKRVIEGMDTMFGDARAEYHRLRADTGYVDSVLAQGASRAREHASAVRDRAYAACGLR
ncbi:MAG: tryptophan--tRNA ligase [Planctomycetota bacterium]|nr:tryptophan--tRNA ligase [Planctomycetota bacterium]MEE2713185.1 tryptophan--tRNA ligase [Planctomycetota bacterium]